MSPRAFKWTVAAAAVVAYVLLFPGDLAAVEALLRLTGSVAPGAYAVVVALILVAGAVRIWGRRPPGTEVPP
jgi:hypothetical protein